MKKIILVLTVLLSVFSAGVSYANEGQEECKMPPPYVGSAEFQRMKSLAGTWEGEAPMSPNGKIKVTYEVTSNGSAVLERMGRGTSSEMVTVYHDEKGKLVMTHYCAIGNQPKLKLQASSSDKINLVFAKNNLINPKKEDHMHSLEITFLGPDQIRQAWAGYMDCKLLSPLVVTLNRVKEAAATNG